MSTNHNVNNSITTSQNLPGSDTYGISEDLRIRLINAIELNLKSQIRKLFPELHSADQADFIYSINTEQREKLIKVLGNKFDPELLVELDGDAKDDVIRILDIKDLAQAVSRLDTDDAVEIIDNLDENTREKILREIKSVKKREEIEEGLSYPEGTVGRLMMHKNYVAIPKDWKVGEVIKYIKRKRDLPNDFGDIIVVDNDFRPISEVSVSKIIKSDDLKRIEDIMDNPENLKFLSPNTEQEEASRLFTKYSLTSAPVVDEKGILVGVVLMSDIIDVIEEETREDILHLGNVSEDDVYLNILSAAKSRFPWLISSLCTAAISASVIRLFSGTIAKFVTLAVLMPMIASLGGVASNQTLTVLVRSLATKEVNKNNFWKIILKEILMGMLNGFMMAICAGSIVFFWKHNLLLSLVFGGTIVFIITLSGLLGTTIPLILHKLKLDPAVTSSTFIAASIDSLSFLIFLGMATLFIL